VGPFTGAVLVAEEKRLDAGFDAACSRGANLPRIGALIHEVAFERGQRGLTG
jgi:hypothetical protein